MSIAQVSIAQVPFVIPQVFHYRVTKGPQGIFISKEHPFPTLRELVDYHSKKADGLVFPLKVRARTVTCLLLYLSRCSPHRLSISSLSAHVYRRFTESTHLPLDHRLTRQHPVPKKQAVVFGVSKEADDKWEIDRAEITLGSKLGAGQYGEVYEGTWRKYNKKVRPVYEGVWA